MIRRVLRGVGLCATLLFLSMSLCGCMFEQAEGLYALPILPEEYSQLQSTIQDVMDQQGAEYATISSGDNTSTVQLLDLNGDGQQEMAAVFLRVTSAEEKPLRVCLFRKGADNNYRLTYVVEGDGTSINSVGYEDVTGDGVLDLIVSWQMSTKVHILSAYALLDAGVYELMSTTYNESYLVSDMDKDGVKEIVVCHQDSTGEGINLAEYYDYSGGVMTMSSSARLSNEIYGIYSMVAGKLSDGTPAVFASSLFSGGSLTDVLTVQNGQMRNVTYNKEAGYSQVTARVDTGAMLSDINKDGILEIPISMQLPNVKETEESGESVVYWCQVDGNGSLAVSCVTYHCQTDGWYLVLPDSWPEHITVARDDSLSHRGERSVVFYHYSGEEGAKPQPFLTIYRLTGSNREARAMLPGRVTLYRDSTTIYAAALDESVWDCGLEQEELAQRFFLITAAWDSE
ncbi:VCBS repeat-containing protein [Pseudoflavonifractor sp. An85]|uniref:FG-GAP repeat domain-containing protein n=1 Tax=Pseudoflavonifractor sp. An85 TaxID=1965661 RepID=UPI001179A209|nr:VCBS repeat-containing protein [Pseudoflavonifractor sp. An85]